MGRAERALGIPGRGIRAMGTWAMAREEDTGDMRSPLVQGSRECYPEQGWALAVEVRAGWEVTML